MSDVFVNKNTPNASFFSNLKVIEDVGEIDILVNNAGIVTGKPFLESEDSSIRKTMQVNSMAHFWVSFFQMFLFMLFLL